MFTSKAITLVALNLITTAVLAQTAASARIYNVSIDTMGIIKWTATYTSRNYESSIYVERFINNKWIQVEGGSTSVFPIVPDSTVSKHTETDSCRVKFHKGANRYRLSMTEPEKITSEEVVLMSKVSNDDGSLWIAGSKIFLDEKLQYEILDKSGTTIEKGSGKTLDISGLPKGSYFLYTKKWTKSFDK